MRINFYSPVDVYRGLEQNLILSSSGVLGIYHILNGAPLGGTSDDFGTMFSLRPIDLSLRFESVLLYVVSVPSNFGLRLNNKNATTERRGQP